jgi:hypothetical protein
VGARAASALRAAAFPGDLRADLARDSFAFWFGSDRARGVVTRRLLV